MLPTKKMTHEVSETLKAVGTEWQLNLIKSKKHMSSRLSPREEAPNMAMVEDILLQCVIHKRPK